MRRHISTRQRAVIDVDNAVMIGHAQSYKSVITLARLVYKNRHANFAKLAAKLAPFGVAKFL